jgi:hypothetical protein
MCRRPKKPTTDAHGSGFCVRSLAGSPVAPGVSRFPRDLAPLAHPEGGAVAAFRRVARDCQATTGFLRRSYQRGRCQRPHRGPNRYQIAVSSARDQQRQCRLGSGDCCGQSRLEPHNRLARTGPTLTPAFKLRWLRHATALGFFEFASNSSYKARDIDP